MKKINNINLRDNKMTLLLSRPKQKVAEPMTILRTVSFIISHSKKKRNVRKMSKPICKQDLINLGYKPYTATRIIRQSKQIMVERGCPLYNNKRLGLAPKEVVEEVLGFSLEGVVENG
jgi:Protein of unknown function (DUF3173).